MTGELSTEPAGISRASVLFLDNVGDEKNLSIGVVLNWPSLVVRKAREA